MAAVEKTLLYSALPSPSRGLAIDGWTAVMPGSGRAAPMMQITYPGDSDTYREPEVLSASQVTIWATNRDGKPAVSKLQVGRGGETGRVLAIRWPESIGRIVLVVGSRHSVLLTDRNSATILLREGSQ